MKTTDDLVRIVSFGGSVVITAALATDDIVRIVSFAANKGGVKVTLKGASSKTTDDLVRIASFGRGLVEFDFTS
jgi:hypothetical protein